MIFSHHIEVFEYAKANDACDTYITCIFLTAMCLSHSILDVLRVTSSARATKNRLNKLCKKPVKILS